MIAGKNGMELPLSIPLTKEMLMALTAVFAAGAITLLGLACAAIVGTCWGIAYLLTILLAHTSSTQMFLMFIVGIVLYHIGRRVLRSASLFRSCGAKDNG